MGSFFYTFEKIAKELEWSEDKWTLLRVQVAYAALDVSDSREYDTVRKVVLAVYEVVPEAHLPRFWSLQ